MRYTTGSTLAFVLATTVVNGLTITSPSAGSTIDPSQPITITWTSDASDPPTINLSINTPSGLSFNGAQVGSNIQTSSGSYTVPANTLTGYGNGYSVTVTSTSGNTLASSDSILLQYNTGQSVTTEPNGDLSLVPSSAAAAATSSATSIVFDTSGIEGQSVTASYLPSTDLSATVTDASATASSTAASETSSSDSSSSSSSSRSTSSSMRTSTSASATSSAASTATSAAGAAVKTVGTGAGLVGFVAGLLALVV